MRHPRVVGPRAQPAPEAWVAAPLRRVPAAQTEVLPELPARVVPAPRAGAAAGLAPEATMGAARPIVARSPR